MDRINRIDRIEKWSVWRGWRNDGGCVVGFCNEDGSRRNCRGDECEANIYSITYIVAMVI